jgi:hypothetical protein
MTEAKLGLLIVTALIWGFALLLQRQGAVSPAGALIAGISATGIAAMLFLTQ